MSARIEYGIILAGLAFLAGPATGRAEEKQATNKVKIIKNTEEVSWS